MDLRNLPRPTHLTSQWSGWRRRPEAPPRRLALAAIEIADIDAAHLDDPWRLVEIDQMRQFLRAGGSAVVRR